jgi:hypothetical protein
MLLAVAALVPLALIAVSRARPSPARPVHPVLDMDKQQKFKGQEGNPMFADGRAMRPRIPGTVAREDLTVDNSIMPKDAAEYDRIMHGVERQGDKMGYVKEIPVSVSLDFMRRGQERYNIYCSACHGLSGYGDGMVARRGEDLRTLGNVKDWNPPVSYHSDNLRSRTMPAHGAQIPVLDRWAIVAYVKALQRSQHAKAEDVPETEKQRLQ